MKTPFTTIFGLLTIAAASQLSATVIWTEDFTQADGAFTDRATNGGSGNIDVNGTTSIVSNALVITADGGNDRVEFESTAGALAGFFTFDITITGGTTDIIFLQMVEGVVRSTGGAPVPNFSDTIDVSSHSIGSPSTVRYYFNNTGSDLNYTGPDSSAQVLSTGNYDYWVDSTLTNAEQTNSNNGLGAPTGGVDTLILQTFGGQSGEVVTIDNASLETIDPIPEPSALALFGISALGLLVRRRK